MTKTTLLLLSKLIVFYTIFVDVVKSGNITTLHNKECDKILMKDQAVKKELLIIEMFNNSSASHGNYCVWQVRTLIPNEIMQILIPDHRIMQGKNSSQNHEECQYDGQITITNTINNATSHISVCQTTSISNKQNTNNTTSTILVNAKDIILNIITKHKSRFNINLTTLNHNTDDINYTNKSNGINQIDDFLCIPPCDNKKTNYFPPTNRCDGIVHCAHAEDEFNCTETCADAIQCVNESICIDQSQICNGIVDCNVTKFDEIYCAGDLATCSRESWDIKDVRIVTKEDMKQLKRFPAGFAILLIVLLFSILFFCLLMRCFNANRANLRRRLMDYPPEMPLPNFQGPGENDSSATDTHYPDNEFHPGGDLYENLAKSVEFIKDKRRKCCHNAEITYTIDATTDNQTKHAEEDYFAALATIKLTTDMCVGLPMRRPQTSSLSSVNISDTQSNQAIEQLKKWRTDQLRTVKKTDEVIKVKTSYSEPSCSGGSMPSATHVTERKGRIFVD